MARKKSKPGKGRQVGGEVRPTTQRILESMSATLQPWVEGARVLDLFAGTGRVGLEMAECGAASVVFVEGHRRVAQALRQTIRKNQVEGELSLVLGAIPDVLAKLTGPFDLILCDPPYDWSEPESLLPGAKSLLSSDGLLLVEHHHKTEYVAEDGWELFRCQKFGETRLSYFRLLVDEPDDSSGDEEH